MNTFRIIPALLGIFALAGPAYPQTVSTTLDFIGTGNASFTTASNWVEVSVGAWPPDPNWQTLGQNRVPGDRDSARIREGANVTLNSNLPNILHLYVGGPAIEDPNWNGDPNVYPFGYESMPASSLTIATGATLMIDPNRTQDPGKGGNTQIGNFYKGTLNMTGGSFAPCWFRLGEGMGSTGILNLSGGTMTLRYRMNMGRMGGKRDPNGNAQLWGNGYGEVNMSDGVLNTDIVGRALWIGTLGSYTLDEFDPNGNPYIAEGAGKAVFNLSGGLVTGVTARVGKDEYQLDPHDANASPAHGSSVGILNITGGSFANEGSMETGSKGGNGTVNVTGGTLTVHNGAFSLGMTASGPWHIGTGLLHVGPGGRFETGASTTDPNNPNRFRIYDPDPNGGQTPSKVVLDFTNAGMGVIRVLNGGVSLGSMATLDANSIGGFRPKQADTFTAIDNTGTGGGSGWFDKYTSNVTVGLDPNWNDPNTAAPRAFTGAWVGNDYVLTFRGFTGGDPTQDGNVSLGDIGIVAGNWGKSGQTWAQGDFTGDGVVGLGDIGILAGNWGWSRPGGAPVPEPATMALLALGGAALIRRRR
jgi:hypothetical protein